MTDKDLYNIIDDLNRYKRDKSKLLTFYVNERLNKSLETYYKELSSSFDYLNHRDGVKVMKDING